MSGSLDARAKLLETYKEQGKVSAGIDGEFLDRASAGPYWNQIRQAFELGFLTTAEKEKLGLTDDQFRLDFDALLASTSKN